MNSSIRAKERVEEKLIRPLPGLGILLLSLLLFFGGIASFILGVIRFDATGGSTFLFIAASPVMVIVGIFLMTGLRVLKPNEALVLTLFGKYYGTIAEAGFYFVNPFARGYNPPGDSPEGLTVDVEKGEGKQKEKVTLVSKKKISLKTMTLNNKQQKVNDVLGNPIIIGSIVIWRVVNPTEAVFSVEDYQSFLSIQCDSTIRNIARLYPYDTFSEDESDDDETTLRGSAIEIADRMQEELQKRVNEAGLLIEDVRITHLAYAEEIAAAMLQRQQAVAIIAARKKIVEGAVGMVQMAIDTLSEDETVVLDEERKATMISNLMVVLCGNKDVQPVVNSGSIY